MLLPADTSQKYQGAEWSSSNQYNSNIAVSTILFYGISVLVLLDECGWS